MSSVHPDYPSLQVQEDATTQQRLWVIQRVGWVLLALFLLAGALGAFGGAGPFGTTEVRSDDGALTVRHARFARYVAPTRLTIELAAPAVDTGKIDVAIARSYVEVFEPYDVSPTPVEVRADGDFLVYAFAVTEGRPATLELFGRPHAVGRLRGSVRVGQRAPVPITTWVHP